MDIYGLYKIKDETGKVISEGHNLVVDSGRRFLASLIAPSTNPNNVKSMNFYFGEGIEIPNKNSSLKDFGYKNTSENTSNFNEETLEYTFTINVNDSSLEYIGDKTETVKKLIGCAGLVLTLNDDSNILFSKFSFSSQILVSANTSLVIEYSLYF